MGREQRRKEQFKNKNKKINKEELDTSIKLETTVKLVCFIVILLFVIYYGLAVFITKEIDISNGSSNEETAEESSNQTDNKILASTIFEQREEEYYVYFYDFNDKDELVDNTVMGLIDKVYRVDTSNGLNSKYITEEDGNKDATGLDDLKVKSPTIIKIKADKIVEYYEGSSEIANGLKDVR